MRGMIIFSAPVEHSKPTPRDLKNCWPSEKFPIFLKSIPIDSDISSHLKIISKFQVSKVLPTPHVNLDPDHEDPYFPYLDVLYM